MCGIFGITSNTKSDIHNKILDGLKLLQNRGYDSSGLCTIDDANGFQIAKYASTLNECSLQKLENRVINFANACVGIGHNRWATHGIKNDTNAHPHISNNGKYALVHNGIIENYNELKRMLQSHGYVFYSQTDTEIIVNLIQFNYNESLVNSLAKTIGMLQGTYGILLLHMDEPTTMYCVRNGSPLLVGKNENCVIATSEQSGFNGQVASYITLHNDDICVIRDNTIFTSNTYISKQVTAMHRDLKPDPFMHWTIKEIYDQPATVLNAINNGGRILNANMVKLGGLEMHMNKLIDTDNIILLGCGTSYFAGLYGMHFFKRLCKFNSVQVFDGAEFSEHDIPKYGKTALILVSQSGETKDLYRCLHIGSNLVSIGVINVIDSLIAREVDCGVYCNAGTEVGVASTKAFTSQVVCLSLMAIWFAQIHDWNESGRRKVIQDLHNLSNDIQSALSQVSIKIESMAVNFVADNLFILGKESDACVAYEGSLKIKEISYIHSEGYSASSLKHGPFALLCPQFPVIILNTDPKHDAKIMNCVEEIRSRDAPITVIGYNRNADICVPLNNSYSSLLGLIPLQLFAYYLSVSRGHNPDKPKNLAKVVTVE